MGVRPNRATLLVGAALAVLAACGQVTTSIGNVSLDVPEGWSVTNRSGNNLQIADGTTGGATGTEPGTATAVFDVYVSSELDHEELADQLRSENVGVKVEHEIYGGAEAVVLTYAGYAGSGRQIAVAFPGREVHIIYRAAFADDDAAFFAGRSAFLRALRSISFS